MVPSADTAEAGDKHARTEAQPSGSPTKGAKKPKTDVAEAGKDQTAENGAAKGLASAVANSSAKPASPKKGGAAASKEPEAVPEVKTNTDSPKKAAPGSPRKGASSPKKGAIAEKVEAAVPAANKA